MAAPNDRSDFHVLIIGAGSVGLLIAQRLKSLGIKCTVFDRENFLNERSRDWSYGLYWAQSWLRECLPDALHGRLNAAQVDPTRSPSPSDNLRLLNGKTAEQFTRVPTPNLYRLRRSQFRALLAEGIDVQVLHLLSIILSVNLRLQCTYQMSIVVWHETHHHFQQHSRRRCNSHCNL